MLHNQYPYLDENVINFINQVISSNPRFSENRFISWLARIGIEKKTNPSAFVNKVFLGELNKGTFSKPQAPDIEYLPNITPMIDDMQKKGIEVTPDNSLEIDIINTWLLKNEVLPQKDLIALNHQIVDYLAENNLSGSSYQILLRKSKTLDGKYVDWVEIGQEINKAKQDWQDLLEDMPDEL